MANEQNLKPVQSKKEARERGKAGGIASGKARRKRKTLREELLLLLEQDDTQNKVSTALIKEAKKGNTKAFEIIRDTIGEKPKEQIQHSGNINNPFAEMTTEELRQMIKDD